MMLNVLIDCPSYELDRFNDRHHPRYTPLYPHSRDDDDDSANEDSEAEVIEYMQF